MKFLKKGTPKFLYTYEAFSFGKAMRATVVGAVMKLNIALVLGEPMSCKRINKTFIVYFFNFISLYLGIRTLTNKKTLNESILHF